MFRALLEAARQAGTPGQADAALQRVVALARDFTGADGALLAVAKASGGFSRRVAAPANSTLPIAEIDLRTALGTDVPLVLGEALAVRVPAGDVPAVVLAVSRRGGTWSDDDITVLETVALHTATILAQEGASERAHAASSRSAVYRSPSRSSFCTWRSLAQGSGPSSSRTAKVCTCGPSVAA